MMDTCIAVEKANHYAPECKCQRCDWITGRLDREAGTLTTLRSRLTRAEGERDAAREVYRKHRKHRRERREECKTCLHMIIDDTTEQRDALTTRLERACLYLARFAEVDPCPHEGKEDQRLEGGPICGNCETDAQAFLAEEGK